MHCLVGRRFTKYRRRSAITHPNKLTSPIQVGLNPLISCTTYTKGIVQLMKQSRLVERIKRCSQIELQD